MKRKHRCSQCGLKFSPLDGSGDTSRCPWCDAMAFALTPRGVDAKDLDGTFKPFVDDRPTGKKKLYTSRRQWLADLHRGGMISHAYDGKPESDNTGVHKPITRDDVEQAVGPGFIDHLFNCSPELQRERCDKLVHEHVQRREKALGR